MPLYDLAIIGGGIAGLGIFESAGRAGLRVVLLEGRGVPGRETTAVTSGLLHGGLRYLPYDVATSALMCREIARLRGARPDLLTREAFLWPVYRGERLGLGLIGALQDEYDAFAGLRGARRHARLSSDEAVAVFPGLRREGLLGAEVFDEWRVDVPGLVASLVDAGRAAGGELLTGWRVVALSARDGRIAAATAEDGRGGRLEIEARVFVNAAGPGAEKVAELAGASSVRLRLRKGVHLVVAGEPPPHGLIFTGPGGRRIGVYPRPTETWVGPTDQAHDGPPDELAVSEGEREGLRLALAAVLPGLAARPCRAVAGLRPIPRRSGAACLLSREHHVFDHSAEGLSNFVSVAGGKLTTYRPLGEDVVAAVLRKLGRTPPPRPLVGGPRGPVGALCAFAARGRAVGMAASTLLLAGYAVRRVLAGRGRAGWAAFEAGTR
ncbi:MAG: FAD-dependent oxidoreductase [Elusimicrobia bacterium]|nr:FAD-dependent oxidoreductase [Elusimicrobiota bacterium]